MIKIFEFEELNSARLIIDALYKSGNAGNAGDDPLSKIFNIGNIGGFRISRSTETGELNYVVLTSSLNDINWPDHLDYNNGLLFYFGDNKTPGNELHDTHHRGNLILKECFDKIDQSDYAGIPPFFFFTNGPTRRDKIFRGLAVPGALTYKSSDNLVALWKNTNGSRYQNYKAVFTILDINEIKLEWVRDLESGNKITSNTPNHFKLWNERGQYTPLISERAVEYRSKDEQLPSSKEQKIFINTIYHHFASAENSAYDFEKCAAEIVKLMDKNITTIDLTRPWNDGGRDGLGKYSIGYSENSINVNFTLEAKRYDLNNGVGVRETSRLIARLRHRQFGFLVTTSYVGT